MDSLINLQSLVDEAKCFETVRRLRWPEGDLVSFAGSQRS